jgi:hypothetical protein
MPSRADKSAVGAIHRPLRVSGFFCSSALVGCVALKPLIKEIGHDVLINLKIEDRGELNNEMSTL